MGTESALKIGPPPGAQIKLHGTLQGQVTLDRRRRRRSLPAAFRASWQPATDEPLLWLPDIAAGAAALAAIGDATYWDDLAATFSVERFTPI